MAAHEGCGRVGAKPLTLKTWACALVLTTRWDGKQSCGLRNVPDFRPHLFGDEAWVQVGQ